MDIGIFEIKGNDPRFGCDINFRGLGQFAGELEFPGFDYCGIDHNGIACLPSHIDEAVCEPFYIPGYGIPVCNRLPAAAQGETQKQAILKFHLLALFVE
jgi:hypothetical protein